MTQSERIHLMLPKAKTVSNEQIEFLASKAHRQTEADGVSHTSALYPDIIDTYICYLLFQTKTLSGTVTAKSVGDVSTSFTSGEDAEKSYRKEYINLVRKAAGIKRF